ncbi:glycosyltransferase [Patescibacteria group bacterium]|nr:glycosyltransferase [Patescibacteria group bacterium]
MFKQYQLVSIIIINWNGLKWLSDCFRTIHNQDYKNFEIIFVDNASRDESVMWVKNNYPKQLLSLIKKI